MKKIQYILLAFAIMLPFTASAATFTFSPALGSYTTGETFSTSVFVVPAAGETISATKVSLTFSASQLEVTSYTPENGGSILAHIGTATDNAAGTIVDNVAFNPGITASTKIATVTFKAKATGGATLAVATDSKILDSTNVDKQTSSVTATYTVAEPVTTPAPVVTTTEAPAATPSTAPASTQDQGGVGAAVEESADDPAPEEATAGEVAGEDGSAIADGAAEQLAAAASSVGLVGTIKDKWIYLLLILLFAIAGWWFAIGKRGGRSASIRKSR